MNCEKQLLKLISEQLGKEEVRLDHRFIEDLGADSLDHVSLMLEIEIEFNVEIPDATAEKLKTVQDVACFIDQYRRNR